ncbi:phage late control protein GPD [compost metagenome]
MQVQPDYRLFANSEDITALTRERFVSLRYTDEAGLASDILEVTLADHLPNEPIELPPKGAELELFLGYDGDAVRVGLFVVDELELCGGPASLVIRARAATYDKSKGGKTNLQTQKTRSWPKGTKLGAMVQKIAKEHGMEAAVAKSLASIVLPHIDQADESDLNLLLRVAKKYDAIVKPSGGKLVVAKRGEAKSISGEDLPAVTVTPQDIEPGWRMVQSARESAGMVVAYYHAVKEAKRHSVKVGQGEPVRRIKQYFPTQEMARAAARAELNKRERGALTWAMSMTGGMDMQAEGKLFLEGFRVGVPTEWIITRVVHTLDAGTGWKSDVEAEQPDAKAADDTVEDVAD